VIYNALLFLHLVICVILVLVVLLQAGKGGGLAGAFGGGMGGAGQTLFGGRGAATFLSKATTILGIAFMTSSLLLAVLSGTRGEARSVLREGEFAPGAQPPPVSSEPVTIPGGFPPLGDSPAGTEAPSGTLEPDPEQTQDETNGSEGGP